LDIHVITPFFRKHLLPTLIHYLSPLHIQWHPVCDPVDIEAFLGNTIPWIKPLLCGKFQSLDMSYRKINDFIDAGNIAEEDYYCFMCDDDMYEPGFFDIVRKQTAKIIFFSCYRGDTVPNIPGAENHPVYPLIIRTANDIQTCNIGLGMYIVKGEILRRTKFNNTHKWDDGRYAEDLKNRWPADYIIIPDLFIFGNYFEPGRFVRKECLLKSNWELPQII
jgi:hypothetical protein